MDLKISDLFAMQNELQAAHPEWGGNYPARAREQLLYGVAEIGEVIAFISSERASYLNGQWVLVNGGK